MGLDSTVYIAAAEPPSGNEPMLTNPFAPDAPKGLFWFEMFEWRKHYVLDSVLGEGIGSPDWVHLGPIAIRDFQTKIILHWTGKSKPMACVSKYKRQDIKFIVWARHALLQGSTLLYERVT